MIKRNGLTYRSCVTFFALSSLTVDSAETDLKIYVIRVW